MLGGKGAKRAYISGFLTAGTEGHRFTNATGSASWRCWMFCETSRGKFAERATKNVAKNGGAGAGIENVDQSRSKPCFDGAAQSQGTLLGTLEKIAMAGYLAS